MMCNKLAELGDLRVFGPLGRFAPSTASSGAEELGGGSIRIHQPDLQKTVFEDVLQLTPEITEARFGYMLEAFKFGCPPHGGIALGFDRLIALLCGADSIRDVVAFPKTAKGTCLMTDSPGAVEPRQLRELHIEVKTAKQSG